MSLNRIAATHRFLSRQLLYPLLLCTLLALVTWAARVVVGGRWVYSFLPTNLWLAWIPYLLSGLTALFDLRWPGKWWLLPVPFAAWLVFFPNAPYVVTDLSHLATRPGAPLWYDMIVMVSYAWAGCFLGIVSLNSMQAVVRRYTGGPGSWLFVASVLLLTGLGVYLGQFLRLNSWDLFLQPQLVLAQIAQELLHPVRNIRAYGVILMFSSFLLVCYLTFVSVERRERS